MINFLKQKRRYFIFGRDFHNNIFYKHAKEKTDIEGSKKPLKFEVINYIIDYLNRDVKYLEIGVRNPNSNFNKIKAKEKYGVDPGLEFVDSTIDFKCTSDDFFSMMDKGDVLDKEFKFDIIFIDGLHLAEQVEKDINNALKYVKSDGFIVLHDCNPPTEFHARENYDYKFSPAKLFWNGTTWKAFFKARQSALNYSCCIDADWGIGIISKTQLIGTKTNVINPYFEYKVFKENRKESLNLMSFDKFKKILK